MEAQHQRAIDRVTAHFRDDPRFPAMLIGGSVAKGRARPDSDVDIMLVATDEEYAHRHAAGDTLYFTREFTDYPEGYVDGKILSLGFLREAADRGSEPTRAAFVGAWVAYSRLPEVADLLARIPVYPEHEQAAKIAGFYTQMVVNHWYIGEAGRHGNRYLLTHAAADLVLFGGRLILAHNKILYPFHKWFMYELAHAPEQPADLIAQADSVLRDPTKDTARRFYESVTGFRDWGMTEHDAFRRWTEDYEWAWRTARPLLADW
jgi:hypothetical protein